MIKTIDTTSLKKWNSEIHDFINSDFYFLFGYQEKDTGKSASKLIIFTENEFKIGLPIVFRKIGNSSYSDATSVYGYAGPLRSHKYIPLNVISKFKQELEEYFTKCNIISVFSRFHPLFEQKDLLNGLGEIISLSQTISIDLSLPVDEQRKQYRKGVKSDLSRLRKRNLEVIEDINKKRISEFIEIYNENMERVNAASAYFFPMSYYEELFGSDDIDARLYFVKDGNRLIAGSIFVFTDDVIQYHLSGTRSDSLQNSPVRLLIDHVRILGTERGYKYFHLGGGVGSVEDALFNFKAGFSKKRHSFKIWKYIVNQKAYDDLVSKNGIKEDSGYFPLYRSNSKLL